MSDREVDDILARAKAEYETELARLKRLNDHPDTATAEEVRWYLADTNSL